MAKMKKYALKESFVQVPNATAKAVEKREEKETISLQALGLLVNLWSYNVEEWELHKTELYKRYGQNKKTSVASAWDELVEHQYIIEFKYRDGRKWEHVYVYRIEAFSEEEKEQIIAESVVEYGVSSASDFQHLKMRTPKPADNQYSIKEIKTKEIKTQDILSIDNYQETIQSSEETYETINIQTLTDACNEFYSTFAPGRYDKRQWNTLIQKYVLDTFMNGHHIHIQPEKLKGYVFKSLQNITGHHDYKRSEEYKEYKESVLEINAKPIYVESSNHFYNWLEERE